MTDIEKYDRAVYRYLATISPKITYALTQNAMREITKKKRQSSDDIPWNFISFYRDPVFEIDWNRMNNPATVSGDFVRLTKTDNGREARYVNNIPVNLTYSVDLWASKASEVQELAIALITKIYMQEQVLLVPINPEGEDGRFHLLNATWTDNSDLERETEIGKIYRHTITFTVDARVTLVVDKLTTELCAVPVNIYE